MPIIKSAKKRVLVAAKQSAQNTRTKRSLKASLKAFDAAVTAKKGVDAAQSSAQSAIDTAVKKGVISKNKAARQKSRLNAQAKAVSTGKRTSTPKKKTAAPKPATKKAAPKKATPAKTSKADDLTTIEGVGPKINDILHAGGIATFQNLADAKVADIKKLLEEAGPRYKSHDPGTWPKQSKLAAAGDFEALKKLQDELDGGK